MKPERLNRALELVRELDRILDAETDARARIAEAMLRALRRELEYLAPAECEPTAPPRTAPTR
jgi:hypothetical protein